MSFWIITSAIALVIAGMLALVLLRTRSATEPAAAFDLRVYRTQLKDVETDLERGVISEADATRIRTEVSRRILKADETIRAGKAERRQSRTVTLVMAAVLALATVGGSLALYRELGAPGYGDFSLSLRKELAEQARMERPRQAEAEATLPPYPAAQELSEDYLNLLERLRETVAQRPDDVQGHVLLARNEAASGNFAAAYAVQGDVIRLKGDEVTAEDYANQAEMMVLAAGGYVSPEAEVVLDTALRRAPQNGPARYYWGLMMTQTGRPDMAFRIWAALLRDSPPNARWVPPIRAQIEEMAQRAGVQYTLPPLVAPSGGPTAEDVAAASDMSPQERQEMIRGMVQSLSDRLASQGGPPTDWARLIGALGVLGDTEQARAIYDNAVQVFAGNDAALEPITAAARQAGVLQ